MQVEHHQYMAQALRLARRGLYTTDPNPRVGCVIVADGKVVGEGWHARAGGPHAEVVALQAAGERAKGADVYVTLEPCSHFGRTPPCVEALVAAAVSRVIVAMEDPNPEVSGAGIGRLRDAGIEVICDVLSEQAHALNPGFLSRMATGRPYVRNKFGMSLDGGTALANGVSQWITSPEARVDVQKLRARSSAIVTGIGTVLADNPSMTARLDASIDVLQPVRVVLDSELKIPLDAAILAEPETAKVVTLRAGGEKAARLRESGVEVVSLPEKGGRIDPAALMLWLGGQEMNEVLLECGATLAGSLLSAGMLDEIILYMAPKLMGSDARGIYKLPELENMDSVPELDIVDIRAVGKDWRVTAKPIRS